MSAQKPRVPSLVSLAILTTITIVLWAGFAVYRSIVTKPDPGVPQDLLAPITPNLDTDTMDKINTSLYFEESSIPLRPSAPSSSPSSTPTPTPTGSPSASPTVLPTYSPSPSPTSSGGITL